MLAVILLAACARQTPVAISVDEAKVSALVESPKLLSQAFSFAPSGVPLTKSQLLQLNPFLQQAAAMGASRKEEVPLTKDSPLFAAIDVSLSASQDWRRLKGEFAGSPSIPASRVAETVEKFAR